MREILRSNDWVRLSFMQALLRDAGIESIILDQHTSILEGSIGAISRRLMVTGEDEIAARRLLSQSEQYGWGAEDAAAQGTGAAQGRGPWEI